MKPRWLEEFDGSRKGKTRGYVLEGNTADAVFYPESGIPPTWLRYFLASYLTREGCAVGQFSLANGFEELRPPGVSNPGPSPFSSLPQNVPPEQMLKHMTRLLRRRDGKPIALIIDYGDHVAPSSAGLNVVTSPEQLVLLEILHSWGQDENIRLSPNLVILISYESQVSELLLQNGSGYKRIDISLPNENERQAFIEALRKHRSSRSGSERKRSTLLRRHRRTSRADEDGHISPGELARLTSGLPYSEIEQILDLEAKGRAVDRQLVADRKKSVIGQLCRGLLEIHEPNHGFESVSGLYHAKDELSSLVWTIRNDPKSATQALLLVGVPGCGKSWLVLALAKELGYPCLAMRNIREGLVGASERNLERVLWVAETLSPCVIWIDEIDQVLGQRNVGPTMDAGTHERMMGRIWEFMGAMRHRGRILWVGTSNRPDILDPALLDRFQLVIPILHPSPKEVEELLPVLAQQVGRTLAEDVRPQEIAQLPSLRTPTVRALQEVVARAGVLTDIDTGKAGSPVDCAHLAEAAMDYKPNYNPLQHRYIAMTAIRMTSFASLLPWMSRKGLRDPSLIPPYLDEVVDPKTGAVDNEKLSRLIVELENALQYERYSRQF